MNFGSLFAGIGGFDLGFERAGMTCKWQVEIDEYCRKVLTKHWPDVPKYRDIRECRDNLEPVDLICGGFPCQPFSVAGKQKGKDDNRYLWPEMLRVIEAVRPAWVIGENVPGIIRMELDQVLSDLEGISYTTRPFIIPACGIDAPHRRDRVWIICYASSLRCDTRRPEQPLQGVRPYSKVCVADPKSEQRYVCENNRESKPQPLPEFGNRFIETPTRSDWWLVEPNVGRVANGIPRRVDRLRTLGNAVVPQLAEFIGRMILEHERSRKEESFIE